jgi:hypothetical protein
VPDTPNAGIEHPNFARGNALHCGPDVIGRAQQWAVAWRRGTPPHSSAVRRRAQRRYGSSSERPSTRYRDLVDLVAIADRATVDAEQLLRSLSSEVERRRISLPDTFDVPDRALWEPGRAKEAQKSVLASAQTLDEALAIVRPFVDPLLTGTAVGTWDHTRREWTRSGDEVS